MKITQCKGDGLGTCKRCEDYGMDSINWMCFLYEIEGMEGKYCEYCVVLGGHDAVPSLVQQLVKEYKRMIVLTQRDIPSFRR